MINIISKSLVLFNEISGPKKGIENFIKGLDLLGYPYTINKALDSSRRLYIHDDTRALKRIKDLPEEIKVIVGPSLYNSVRDIPKDLDISRALYLQPSEWSMEGYLYFGFNKCKLNFWPMGIDTEEFKPSGLKKDITLVYFKERFFWELEFVENILTKKKINYEVVVYGKYKLDDYKKLLHRSRYIVWVGRQESQGLALEEALASDVPILVWDVLSVGHCFPNDYLTKEEAAYKNTTSAPYFDDSCGLKIKDKNKIEEGIDFMEKNLANFRPREFIMKNLSLEVRSKELILFYEKYFGLSYEEGFKEKPLSSGNWLNAKWYYLLYLRMRHWLKILLIQLGVFSYFKWIQGFYR